MPNRTTCQILNSDAQRKQYVKDNVKKLKHQCGKIKACLEELYSAENPLLVLEGNDLGLAHICRLIQPEEGGESRFKCSTKERYYIQEDLQVHLKRDIEKDSRRSTWAPVRDCLANSNHNGSESSGNWIDQICSTTRQADGNLCGDAGAQHTVEHFLNERLESLQCTCNSLPSAALPLPLIAGSAAGGLIFLVLLIIICVLVRRKTRNSNQSKQRAKDLYKASFQAGAHDKDGSASLYSEISDNVNMHRLRKGPFAGSSGREPPELPSRYTRDPTVLLRNPPSIDCGESPDYLEPLNMTRHYGQERISYDPPWGKGEPDDSYPDKTLTSPPGYDVPDFSTQSTGDAGYETLKGTNETTENNISPEYFELEGSNNNQTTAL